VQSSPQSCWLPAALSGPPLPTNTFLKIKTAGGYVRNDNLSAPAYVGIGDGTKAPEQYTFYDPADQTSTTPIQPGKATILKSRQTGKFCALKALPTGKQGMVCDKNSAADATPFEYTGIGLSFNHQPLVAVGARSPLVLAGSSGSTPGNADARLAFSLPGGRRRTLLDLTGCVGQARTGGAQSKAACFAPTIVLFNVVGLCGQSWAAAASALTRRLLPHNGPHPPILNRLLRAAAAHQQAYQHQVRI
jgi:hypothetical protein